MQLSSNVRPQNRTLQRFRGFSNTKDISGAIEPRPKVALAISTNTTPIHVKIEHTHHVDASDRGADGKYDWYYEYDVYRFTEGDQTLVARSYKDAIEEAHFLRLEVQTKSVGITPEDIDEPLFRQALLHLRSIRKRNIEYLGPEGYAPLPTEA